MRITVSDSTLGDSDADLVAVGIFEGEELPEELREAPGGAGVRSGFKKIASLFPAKTGRLIVAGLGGREEIDAERMRSVAAVVAREAESSGFSSLAWVVPDAAPLGELGAGIVSGTILGTYRFDRFLGNKGDSDRADLESLTLLGPREIADRVEAERVAAEAQNRVRDLQNLPSNIATPSFLAARAAEIAAEHKSVEAEVLGLKEITAKKMGGLLAVSQGGPEKPKLITLRYNGGGDGPTLGLVGKAVTFDTGGISIKPSASMEDMKMDMSGGAAVIEAVGAIAGLGLEINLVAVVPSTENMPSGTAMKPGDVITQYNGKTVEINNTDAEGRLILADALTYCEEIGGEQIIDLATLTGAVLVALGSTYAALISNDDDLAAEVSAAGESTGEIVWRLPLHPEYKAITKGTIADLTNASAKRKAGTIYAGSFLEEFIDKVPWAHLDIAGTAWDTERDYIGRGPTGFGVRLLVDLATRKASNAR